MSGHVHPTEVEGFVGTSRQLVENVAAMRYDKIHEFFVLYAGRLQLEAHAELAQGRKKLAKELFDSAGHASQLAESYNRAFKISKPHMKKELASES